MRSNWKSKLETVNIRSGFSGRRNVLSGKPCLLWNKSRPYEIMVRSGDGSEDKFLKMYEPSMTPNPLKTLLERVVVNTDF